MTNEEIAVPITITINYSEVAGLKGGKSREFETDQIVILKNHVPEFEICSNNLQYPSYIGGDHNLTEDEREENILKYLRSLYRDAEEEIKSRKEIRELERKKQEAEEQKRLAASLDKHFSKTPKMEEE